MSTECNLHLRVWPEFSQLMCCPLLWLHRCPLTLPGHRRPVLPGSRSHHPGQSQSLRSCSLWLRCNEGRAHREPRGPVSTRSICWMIDYWTVTVYTFRHALNTIKWWVIKHGINYSKCTEQAQFKYRERLNVIYILQHGEYADMIYSKQMLWNIVCLSIGQSLLCNAHIDYLIKIQMF